MCCVMVCCVVMCCDWLCCVVLCWIALFHTFLHLQNYDCYYEQCWIVYSERQSQYSPTTVFNHDAWQQQQQQQHQHDNPCQSGYSQKEETPLATLVISCQKEKDDRGDTSLLPRRSRTQEHHQTDR